MATKKSSSTKTTTRAKRTSADRHNEEEHVSLLERASASHAFKAFTVLFVVGIGTSWIMARPALERRAAAAMSQDVEVVFQWPRSSPEAKATWLPAPVQRLLADIATSTVSADPFNQDSLRAARQDLLATGWFRSLERLQRKPGGRIDVDASWRIPAAVVRWGRSDFLVARGGEVLRLPPHTPVAEGSMPLILNPIAPPPTEGESTIFGKAWTGGDVQEAIELIATLRNERVFDRIVGIDLSEYLQRGHLTLLSDQGSRIVWGSALGVVAPAEAPVEKKLANLRDILRRRLDAQHQRIEIYPPVVMIDKTTTG